MATVSCTVAAGGNFGAQCRRLAKAIEQVAAKIPDRNSTGASCVLVINDGVGFAKVTVTGPDVYADSTGITV